MIRKKAKYGLQLSWVSKILIWSSTLLSISPLLSSIIIFGIIPIIPSLIIMFLTSYNQTMFQVFKGIIPFRNTIPAFFAYFWIFVGPVLIYKYEVQLLPEFLWKAKSIVSRDEYLRLNKIASKFPSSTHLWGSILFIFTIFMGWVMHPYAKVIFKVPNLTHLYYIYCVLLMGFITFVATFGICGVIIGIRLVRCLAKCKVFINIADPSRRGGLGFIAGFAIKTTILFASGFAIVPFLYNLSTWITGTSQVLGLTLFSIFILLVLLSFIWPISSVFMMAKRRKVALIQGPLNVLTNEFIERLIEKSTKSKMKFIEINLTIWYIQRLQMVKVIPIESSSIIFQLLTAIGIPTIITVIQYRLTR